MRGANPPGATIPPDTITHNHMKEDYMSTSEEREIAIAKANTAWNLEQSNRKSSWHQEREAEQERKRRSRLLSDIGCWVLYLGAMGLMAFLVIMWEVTAPPTIGELRLQHTYACLEAQVENEEVCMSLLEERR